VARPARLPAEHLSIDGLVAEGSTVVARYIEIGRSVAGFGGRPPTGKTFELVAMDWYELRAGLIARRWGARDYASQARQLGWN
jgi:predicted ester cyclase